MALSRASVIVTLLLICPFSLSAEISDDKFALVIDALKQEDLKTGIDLLKSMAEQGDSYAQTLIGFMYAEGAFFKKDVKKGESWLLKSAEQENIIGQYFLGERLAKRNDAEAIKWYKKLATQGFAESQKRLGDIYFKGKFVLEDYAEALTWYIKAAENGNKKAKIKLGEMHKDGIGAKKDLIKAHMWFNLSGSYYKREKLEKRMNNREVLKAQQLARNWLKAHPEEKIKRKKEMLRTKIPSSFMELMSTLAKTEKKKQQDQEKIAKDDLTLEELEFEHLSKKSTTHQTQDKPKKKSSLLKELDELDRLNKQARAALDKPKAKQTDPKATELLKQLESIKKESVQVKVDPSKLSSPKELGAPGTDALSKYVGKVYVKIYKNWKDPLGGGSGQVQVSFSIFPRGNIAMPKILRSSGDPKLDNLAIRAIKNSVPLPRFPDEIKEPNLPMIIKFDYVPKKR